MSATNIPIMGMSSPPSNKTGDSRGFRSTIASRYAPWTEEGHPRHRNRVDHGCQAEPNKQKHNNRFPERHCFPQAVTIGQTPFATRRGGEEELLSLLALLLPCRSSSEALSGDSPGSEAGSSSSGILCAGMVMRMAYLHSSSVRNKAIWSCRLSMKASRSPGRSVSRDESWDVRPR